MKNTRDLILDNCFKAVTKYGFMALRTDNEIKSLKITKGAFYHHFASKEQLGICLINERLKPHYLQLWTPVLENILPMKEALTLVINNEKARIEKHGLSDVLFSLISESALFEKDMKLCLQTFVDELLGGLQVSIRHAKVHGHIGQTGDSKSQSQMLLSGLLNCYSLAILFENASQFNTATNLYLKQLEGMFFSDTAAPLPFRG